MTDAIKQAIRTIPDYPKAGIQFRDISTLLADPQAFALTIDTLVERYQSQNLRWVAGIEARGFIFGAALAQRIRAGFLPVRKAGKLPGETVSQSYQLEYGEDKVEIHTDTIQDGERVLVVDDLIATGGTAEAAIKLLRSQGGNIIESCFIIDLPDLGGRQRIEQLNCPCYTLCEFEGE